MTTTEKTDNDLEEAFDKLWAIMSTELGHQESYSKRQSKNAFRVLYSIAPSLAANIPWAARWVSRMTVQNDDSLVDLHMIKMLYEIEHLARLCAQLPK